MTLPHSGDFEQRSKLLRERCVPMTQKCEDCGEDATRRTKCKHCGQLVCGWCLTHVHAAVGNKQTIPVGQGSSKAVKASR